jgi:tight adherence protein B
MSPLVVLISLGGMLVLTGLVLLIAALAGITAPTAPRWPAGARRSLPRLRRSWVAAGVLGLVVFVVTGWVAAGIAATGAVFVVPGLWSDTRSVAVIDRLEGLASWTRRLSDLMASGAASSLEAALERSVKTAPASIAGPVGELAMRLGPQGTEAALRAFADELADPAADHVAMALILRHRSGGRGLALVLKELAEDVEVQVRLRRQVEADRAKPRSNVRLVLTVSLLMAAGMALFARDFMAPFSTPVGQVALAVVLGIFAAALGWIRSLTKVVVGARYLTPGTTDPQVGVGVRR